MKMNFIHPKFDTHLYEVSPEELLKKIKGNWNYYGINRFDYDFKRLGLPERKGNLILDIHKELYVNKKITFDFAIKYNNVYLKIAIVRFAEIFFDEEDEEFIYLTKASRMVGEIVFWGSSNSERMLEQIITKDFANTKVGFFGNIPEFIDGIGQALLLLEYPKRLFDSGSGKVTVTMKEAKKWASKYITNYNFSKKRLIKKAHVKETRTLSYPYLDIDYDFKLMLISDSFENLPNNWTTRQAIKIVKETQARVIVKISKLLKFIIKNNYGGDGSFVANEIYGFYLIIIKEIIDEEEKKFNNLINNDVKPVIEFSYNDIKIARKLLIDSVLQFEKEG